jgi:Lar family restriction alleviation protein
MSDKLSPCPFCGSTSVGIADRLTMDRKQQYSVWCYECGNHSTWRYAKETAVAEWETVCERAKVVKPMEATKNE